MTEGASWEGGAGTRAGTGAATEPLAADPTQAALIEGQLVGAQLDTLSVLIGRYHSLVAFVPEADRGIFDGTTADLRRSAGRVMAMFGEAG